MTWNSILAGGLLFLCITGGMIIGAWLASRGFTRALTEIQEETDGDKQDE